MVQHGINLCPISWTVDVETIHYQESTHMWLIYFSTLWTCLFPILGVSGVLLLFLFPTLKYKLL